jgi:hypothetical protein
MQKLISSLCIVIIILIKKVLNKIMDLQALANNEVPLCYYCYNI